MKPCVILFPVLRQDAELVAVVEIQPTQAADFLCVLQRAFQTIDLDLLLRLGKAGEFDRIGIFLNTLQNPLVSVILSELIEPLGSSPTFADDRPVFAVGVKAHTVTHLRHLPVKIFECK